MKPSDQRVNGKRSKTEQRAYYLLSKRNWKKARKILLLQRFVEYFNHKVNETNQSKLLGTYKSNAASGRSNKGHCVSIREENIYKSFFDLIVAVINFYLAFTVPYRIAFLSDYDVPTLYIQDLIIDFILLIDLFLRFFQSYQSETGPVTDLYSISKRALKRFRFYTDVLSIIPLYMLESSFYWLKIGRILRASHILIWLNTSIISKKTLKKYLLKDSYSEEIVFKFMYFALLTALTCHVIACIWYLIPSKEHISLANSWIGSSWYLYSVADLYMRSLYWTAVTVSSVGYGDITPKTLPEMIYTMFVEFLGIMIFAYLMGNASNYITKYYSKKEAVNIRENELHQWLILLENQRHDKKLSGNIVEKIRSFYSQKWASDPSSIYNYQEFFMMLPPDLAEKLNEHLYGNIPLHFESFFEHWPSEVYIKIAALMSPIRYRKNEIILREGKNSDNIIFIVSGSVKIGIIRYGFGIKLKNLTYFAEDSAVFNDESNLTFVANEESDCFLLNFEKVKKILKKARFSYFNFAKIALKRNDYFNKILKARFEETDEKEKNEARIKDILEEFDFSTEELNFEQQEIFDERVKNMKDHKKKNKTLSKIDEKVGLTGQIDEKLFKKEIQLHVAEINKFQNKYEEEIRKIIDSIDSMKNNQV